MSDFLETTTGLTSPTAPDATIPAIAWAVAAGTADAITAAYDPPVLTLTDGLALAFRAKLANTLGTPTFAPDGLAPAIIIKRGGVALAAGDIVGINFEAIIRYNLVNNAWVLLNPHVP